jgi:hypothetical protein
MNPVIVVVLQLVIPVILIARLFQRGVSWSSSSRRRPEMHWRAA